VSDEASVTVLIVDDTPDNLGFLSSALDQEGYIVLVALSGLEALESIEVRTPNVILMDAMMPGIDGFETCRRIKAKPQYADIPIIFMTALSESAYVVEGFAAGGIDYVTKPLKLVEVLARLKAHLDNATTKHIAIQRARQSSTPLSNAQVQEILCSRYQLTARESEVLRWVAFGKTNRDIAQILDLSIRTVDKHLEHVYVKLGVETRTAAMSIMGSISMISKV
jgi:DNA-binding response OmpR family regulator